MRIKRMGLIAINMLKAEPMIWRTKIVQRSFLILPMMLKVLEVKIK